MKDYFEHEAIQTMKMAGCVLFILAGAIFAIGYAVGRWS
jgi:hypothetical protein